MKKNGFTLVEILAVLVLVSALTIILVPNIVNYINQHKNKVSEATKKIIFAGAELYVDNQNLTSRPDFSDENCITVRDVVDTGFLQAPIIDSVSGNEISLDKFIKITYNYDEDLKINKLNYELADECVIKNYYLKKVSSAGTDEPFLDSPIVVRSSIEKITTLATNLVPADALGSWDVGVDEKGNAVSGKVMVWYKDQDDNGLYEVYIGQNGGVKANKDSSHLFRGLENVIAMDLSKLDTSNVTSMYFMFAGTNKLTSLDLSSFDTSNVETMQYMFQECTNLTNINLSSFNTSNVTDMSLMFNLCKALTNLDLSNFNTNKVTYMSYMFQGCRNLTNVNLSSFNTSKVISMAYMFSGCNNLTSLNLKNFDTSNVTNMAHMFQSCGNLTSLDLRSFSTGNVTNMKAMFMYTYNLKEILVSDKWITENVNTADGMFAAAGTDHVTVQ